MWVQGSRESGPGRRGHRQPCHGITRPSSCTGTWRRHKRLGRARTLAGGQRLAMCYSPSEVVEPHAVRLLIQPDLLPDVTVPRAATQGHGYWKWKAAARRHCRDGSLLNKLRTLRPNVFAIPYLLSRPISPLVNYRGCNCQVTCQFLTMVILGFFYRPSSEPRKCSSHVLLSGTLVGTILGSNSELLSIATTRPSPRIHFTPSP
jgi:hypothetical protein